MQPLRSLLFVPANRERFLARLDSLRPDAVILDLEDSVPPSEKEPARAALAELLRSERLADQRLFVRINDFRTGLTGCFSAGLMTPASVKNRSAPGCSGAGPSFAP